MKKYSIQPCQCSKIPGIRWELMHGNKLLHCFENKTPAVIALKIAQDAYEKGWFDGHV